MTDVQTADPTTDHDATLLAINTIRALAMDAVEQANSGHPGTPMALAPLAYLLYTRHMVHNPADACETVGAWREAVARVDGPTMLVLSRQNLPVLEGTDADAVAQGAYVVTGEDEDPDVVLLATGSEVSLAVEAAGLLADRDVVARVVSMPSWELFEQQDDEVIDEVLPPEVPVLSVEAASSFGWSRWADDSVAIEEFGVSSPGPVAFEAFGFTPEAVADAALDLLDAQEDA